jgi:transposase
MTRFSTVAHLASWAGVCPGNNITGGERGSGKTTHGDVWLIDILTHAPGPPRIPATPCLFAQFWRLARRIGKQKAAVAVGHSILVSAYHLLRDGEDYHDLGGNYFDERDRQAVERRLVRRLEALGHKVTLAPAA